MIVWSRVRAVARKEWLEIRASRALLTGTVAPDDFSLFFLWSSISPFFRSTKPKRFFLASSSFLRADDILSLPGADRSCALHFPTIFPVSTSTSIIP